MLKIVDETLGSYIKDLTEYAAMSRCLKSILFHILLCSFIQSTYAEPATDKQAGVDFASAMDQMFAQFFGETQSERQVVDEVAISREQERQIGDTSLQDLLDSLH